MDKHVVLNVYKFAVSSRQNFVATTFIDKNQRIPEKTNRYFNAMNNLNEYLESLSFEQIKIVKTLMYLGRETTNQDRLKYSGWELYKKQYNYFERELNWNGKDLEILSIIGKNNLDELLSNGLKIIGIEV